MKITITGKPKEIAALAVETQRRQRDLYEGVMADKSTEAYKALVKAVRVLRAARFEDEGSDSPASE